MTTNPYLDEDIRYIRREGDGEDTAVVRSGDLYVGFNEVLTHRVDITQEEVREAYPSLSDNTSLIRIASVHSGPTGGAWLSTQRDPSPSEPPRRIGMIHPDHYRASGRLPQLVGEILHHLHTVDLVRYEEALGRLYGQGSDKPFSPARVKGYYEGSRAMTPDNEMSVHIEKIREGELSVATGDYDPNITTAANITTIADDIAAIWNTTLGEFFNPQLKEKPMNLLIIGHQGHGKTDVGQKLAELLKTTAHDSSWFMCERVIYPALKDKYNYESAAECHSDRGYHRQEWFELIEAYNSEPDRLTRAILAEGTIYVGMRSRMEFEGSKHHFDAVIWVDASERIADEPSTSMKLNQFDADYVLDNNGPIEDLPRQIGNLLMWLMSHKAQPTPPPSVKEVLNEASLKGSAEHWQNIESAFKRVRGDICNCTWNPDRHADDCPVTILERAIYPTP